MILLRRIDYTFLTLVIDLTIVVVVSLLMDRICVMVDRKIPLEITLFHFLWGGRLLSIKVDFVSCRGVIGRVIARSLYGLPGSSINLLMGGYRFVATSRTGGSSLIILLIIHNYYNRDSFEKNTFPY